MWVGVSTFHLPNIDLEREPSLQPGHRPRGQARPCAHDFLHRNQCVARLAALLSGRLKKFV